MNRLNQVCVEAISIRRKSPMVIALSLLVALVGVLLYAFTANPKLAQIGIIAYAAGLLSFLLHLQGHALGVLPQ